MIGGGAVIDFQLPFPPLKFYFFAIFFSFFSTHEITSKIWIGEKSSKKKFDCATLYHDALCRQWVLPSLLIFCTKSMRLLATCGRPKTINLYRKLLVTIIAERTLKQQLSLRTRHWLIHEKYKRFIITALKFLHELNLFHWSL